MAGQNVGVLKLILDHFLTNVLTHLTGVDNDEPHWEMIEWDNANLLWSTRLVSNQDDADSRPVGVLEFFVLTLEADSKILADPLSIDAGNSRLGA